MSIYSRVKKFKSKYPGTIAFRLKEHSKVVENIIDKDEQVFYVFCGQKNDSSKILFSSCVVAVTSKRIIIGEKRLLWGYMITSVTPELFNDLKISTGLFFGKIEIDTAKEDMFISNLSKKSLDEIETNVNNIMLDNKRRIHEKYSK